MSISKNDTTRPDAIKGDTADAQERDARQEDRRYERDAKAVFNVLDALEPPAGRQRLLRSGMMILAGAFFLLAIALLLTRYAEELRQQSTPAFPQIAASDLADAIPGQTMVEEGPGAMPNILGVAKENVQNTPGAPNAAVKPLEVPSGAVDTSRPTVPVKESPGQTRLGAAAEAAGEGVSTGIPSIARKPAQETAPHALRKSSLKPAGAQTASRPQQRHARASQQGPRAIRMAAKGKTPVPDKYRRRDADVDLIAALLSRAPQKPGLVKGSDKTSHGSAGTGMQSLQPLQPPQLHAALGGSTANSDIVIRTQADTTESLVKRCGTLGLVEGHLCRVRICAGLWGKDAACPAGNSATLH